MKTRLLIFLAPVVLTVGFAATAARAEWVNVNLDFTLRNYVSRAEATSTAHGEWITSHEGVGTYSGMTDSYHADAASLGGYGTPPPPNQYDPDQHNPAQAFADASMHGFQGAYTLGWGAITGSTEMEIAEETSKVLLTISTGASGGRGGCYDTASTGCSGWMPGKGTLYIGTSSWYPSGAPLWLDVNGTFGGGSWVLKVAGMEYSSATMYPYSVSDKIPVEAGTYYSNFDFSYSDSFSAPVQTYWSDGSSGHVVLTLMDDVEIPEPSTLVLLCSGIAALLAFALRRRE